ncbi:alpha-1B-glycoprotein-like [Alexandromys fortis]|uniref:alpha-1B-glycoprotein-like n=1 Tax=Alexandromys fortis TaxID=100897 RepID=UPI002152B81A|nr:alpha-1B-glycoprotein-like [Microtus fortis]
MSLLAAGLLLLGFLLGPVTDAATNVLKDNTGNKLLPRPWLSVEPVSWITPGLSTFLTCQAPLPNVAFLLKREGDTGFPEVAETNGFLELAGPDGFLGTAKARKGDKERATFLVHKPGTYSCSYLIHTSAVPSAPSDTVTIKEYVIPPPPVLTSSGSVTVILLEKAHRTLVCEAPLMDVEFQLRQSKHKLKLPSISTSPEQVKFYLKRSDLGDQSPFTCRYRLHSNTAWSKDSEPVELMWSDETLPAPVLTAEPSNQTIEPDLMVQFRCIAPKAGLRFGLHREDPDESILLQTLKTAGNEAVFQLHKVSAKDSADYSCSYTELAPPFSGSAPSEFVELAVTGPPPPPKLQALWTGKVPAGSDVVLRCQSKVPGVVMELLRGGKIVPYRIYKITSSWSDLVLPLVGPRHTGNYTCRYTSWNPDPFHSEPSNPVELIVEGMTCRGLRLGFAS